jgi:hypothetical protein
MGTMLVIFLSIIAGSGSIPKYYGSATLQQNAFGPTLVVTKPEKCQLIQPPTTIMGTMLVMFPFSMSVIMLGSVMGLGGAVVFLLPTYTYVHQSSFQKILKGKWSRDF